MMIFSMLLFLTVVISGGKTKQMISDIKKITFDYFSGYYSEEKITFDYFSSYHNEKKLIPFEKETSKVLREIVLDSKKLREQEDKLRSFYFDFDQEQIRKIIQEQYNNIEMD